MDTLIRLKIVSGGQFRGTRVIDADSGRELDGLTGVSWTVDRDNPIGRATIHLQDVPLDVDETTTVAGHGRTTAWR